MSILGISGRIGSGKDTVAMIITYLTNEAIMNHNKNNYADLLARLRLGMGTGGDWKIKKFAYKLKEIVVLLTGCTIQDLEDQDFKNKHLGEEWINTNSVIGSYDISKPPTYREILQWVGTESMRNVIHPNIWVNALFSDYVGIQKAPTHVPNGININFDAVCPNWIISDMRFPNEMQAVTERGGITIRINRDNGSSSYSLHPSETALDNAEFNYVIDNNGTIEELVEKVREILKKETIIN